MSPNCEHAATKILAIDYDGKGGVCSETEWCARCGAWRDRFNGDPWEHPKKKYRPRKTRKLEAVR